MILDLCHSKFLKETLQYNLRTPTLKKHKDFLKFFSFENKMIRDIHNFFHT